VQDILHCTDLGLWKPKKEGRSRVGQVELSESIRRQVLFV